MSEESTSKSDTLGGPGETATETESETDSDTETAAEVAPDLEGYESDGDGDADRDADEPTVPLSDLETEADPADRRSLDELVAAVGDRTSDSSIDSVAGETDYEGERTNDMRSEFAFDEYFDRERIEGIDDETLWEQVRTGGPAATDSIAGHGPEREQEHNRELREVSKRSYCHQCPFFTEPPTVGCSNDGTDILELTSLETFLVADCPRVQAEEALEDGRSP